LRTRRPPAIDENGPGPIWCGGRFKDNVMKYLSALLLSLAVALPAAAGQLYKWTDANGRVQYSDTPPSNHKAEQLKGSKLGSASSGSSKSATPAEQEQAFRKRQTEKTEAAEKLAKDDAAKQQLNDQCSRVRNNLRNLEEGGRISGVDDKGERYYYDDAKIQSEKERLRGEIDKHCS
jgi:hypothetical protein